MICKKVIIDQHIFTTNRYKNKNKSTKVVCELSKGMQHRFTNISRPIKSILCIYDIHNVTNIPIRVQNCIVNALNNLVRHLLASLDIHVRRKRIWFSSSF